MRRRRSLLFAAAPVLALAGLAFIVSSSNAGKQSTNKPSPKQVARCRSVMHLQDDLRIEPLGFYLLESMDDVIAFKFIAKTDAPAAIFKPEFVQPDKLVNRKSLSSLDPDLVESSDWWDIK